MKQDEKLKKKVRVFPNSSFTPILFKNLDHDPKTGSTIGLRVFTDRCEALDYAPNFLQSDRMKFIWWWTKHYRTVSSILFGWWNRSIMLHSHQIYKFQTVQSDCNTHWVQHSIASGTVWSQSEWTIRSQFIPKIYFVSLKHKVAFSDLLPFCPICRIWL